MSEYAIYLRRSRADEEAEARGEGETLSRHRTALFDLARRLNLTVTDLYQEIASGDTIAGRREMQKLLAAVAARKYTGVLCMDVDRLGRGDAIDQGYIMQTFLYSGTKIITPLKTYDPNNQMDFEFFEMRQFFARREYSAIKSRMQAGREMATKEGYFVGSRAPFGYRIVPSDDKKSFTLEILSDQAATVRQIYSWYLHGINGKEAGCYTIAQRLNQMGIRNSLGNEWIESTVRKLISNPVYKGNVTWGKRKQHIEMQDGARIKTRRLNADHTNVRGKHQPIIDEETWKAANRALHARCKAHTTADRKPAFVFSGICKCGVCGKAMIRQPNPSRPEYDILKCSTPGCSTHGSYITTVEKLVLTQLQAWLTEIPDTQDASAPSENPSAQIEKQLQLLEAQSSRLYDLLEQGVYDVQTFMKRQRALAEREKALRDQLNAVDHASEPLSDQIARIRPQIQSVLDLYTLTDSVSERNQLLKSVISRIVYTKPRRRYKNESEFAEIKLDVFPLSL